MLQSNIILQYIIHVQFKLIWTETCTTIYFQTLLPDGIQFWASVFIYLCKLFVVTCAFHLDINIYLFTSSNRSTCKQPPVFIYLCKLLVVPCAVRMNIQYLFVYLFKSTSTELHPATTCICLFMQITCCLHVPFVWIFISICLLIQINVNKATRKRPPVFVYLCKLPVVSMCCLYEY